MRTIGRYELKSKIAQGGMSEVYQALDRQLERDVALKLLPTNLQENPEFIARFEREARIIAKLEHPHIVRLYDYGVDEATGQPFLVMQLMTGQSLLERIETINPAAVWRLIKEIGGALEAAHQAGIVHRDIKPSNILFDKQDNAYLSDFGIAWRADSSTPITGTRVIGTPQYMSPEQCRPNQLVSAASDQYSLGVVIFHLLAKDHLFAGDTMQVMYQHLHDQPSFGRLVEREIPLRVIQAL
ncbi:MAG: serine/threonine-protein kinase, partial [Chloroflexota bacterium]